MKDRHFKIKRRSARPLCPNALSALLLLLFGGLGLTAPGQQRDPKAVEIAQSVMNAMGGQEAWNNLRYVRFDFRVETKDGVRLNRGHLWDKWSGRYRLEQQTEEGKKQVVLFDVNSKQGSVYVGGEELNDSAASEQLEKAHAAFINDMYWLAMPWKWLDSGVNLKYLGEKEREGETFEVVELTFDNVGLTPGDTYHAYVSRDSHLMTYWEYTLQSGNEGAWSWEYGDFNGVKLATNHTNAEGVSINMGEVAVFDDVDEAFFTDPSRSLDQLR